MAGEVMPEAPILFDRALLRARRHRAETLGPATFLLDRAAAELSDRLGSVLRRFDVAIDLGTPGTQLHESLASNKIGTLITVDPVAHEPSLPGLRGSAGEGVRAANLAIAADEEALPFRDASLDLVVSALALHLVNDLPGTLVQIRRALKPDGLFLAALLGGDTLTELRQAFAEAEIDIEGGMSPRVAPFPDLRDLGALLQRAGFALPVTDIDRVTVRYASVFALMHDLRRMGAANALTERRRLPLRRKTLMRMAEIYTRRFADVDGRLRATFEIVLLCGWAPDESQQKPLAPGSAKMRLADALGTTEIPAGEKAGK
jgi:SAM-dependent methyltransferase